MVRYIKKIKGNGWSKYQISVSGHSWTPLTLKPKLTDLISTVVQNEEKTSLQNAGGARKNNLSALKKLMSAECNTKISAPAKTHQPTAFAVSSLNRSKQYVNELLNTFELDSSTCGVRAVSFPSFNGNPRGDNSKKQYTNQCYNIVEPQLYWNCSEDHGKNYRKIPPKQHRISSYCGSLVKIFLIVFSLMLAIYKAL